MTVAPIEAEGLTERYESWQRLIAKLRGNEASSVDMAEMLKDMKADLDIDSTHYQLSDMEPM